MSWGYHLLLDCSECNQSIDNDTIIEKFVVELIPSIGMQAVDSPRIEYLLPKTPNAGYSMMQMIQTSNITAHFVSATRDGYIDLFSCKKFNKDIVITLVKKYFNPKSIKETFLERQA